MWGQSVLFQNDGIEVGGIDYSSSEIEIAGKVLIHDSTKKDAFIAYRKNIIEDYEERYKDLPKFFYEKAFFWGFAQQHNMSIRLSKPGMKGYWNNDYVFDCFMIKEEV